MQGTNKQGTGQFSFSAMPGYAQPPNQPQLQPQHGQPGAQQQQPGQPPMHGGTPSNPFPTGPAQPTVSTGKVPMFPPSKAPGSAKVAHRTVPGGPGTSSGPGVAGAKKEGTSPNLEAKDTKEGIKRSPASRPASQPSKPGAGAATPNSNTGLQPGVPVGGGGTLSPGSLMATQQQQLRQNQVQATLNHSPSLLGAGVGAGGILNGLSTGVGGIGVPSGATANPSTTLPSAGLGFDDFSHLTSMGDLFHDNFSFPALDISGFGSGADDDFMFLNMSDPMDASNLLQ